MKPRRYGLAVLVIASALPALGGCGGGSPSDIVIPNEVNVTLTPVEAPAGASIGLNLAAASGRDVSIEVTANGLTNVTGVAFELAYDPELLEYTGEGPGTFFLPAAALGARVVEAAAGRIVGVAAGSDQQSGRSGGGTLLTLQFRLKQLRDAERLIEFATDHSRVYGPDGVSGPQVFTSSRLVTRIRAPQ